MTAGILVSHVPHFPKLQCPPPPVRLPPKKRLTLRVDITPKKSTTKKLLDDNEGPSKDNIIPAPVSSRVVEVDLTRRQARKVLLKQLYAEEKQCLKLTGVALLYLDMLRQSSTLKQLQNLSLDQTHTIECPMCKSSSDLAANQTLKVEKAVAYLLDYAKTSPPAKEKQRIFKVLKNGSLFSYEALVKNLAFLADSEKFLALAAKTSSLAALIESGDLTAVMERLQRVSEVVQGKKDGLKVLKVQLLKTNKCGVCGEQVKTSVDLARVLGLLDSQLSMLSNSISF